MPPTSIPDLCTYFDVRKTKMYELLQGGKCKYTAKEEKEVREETFEKDQARENRRRTPGEEDQEDQGHPHHLKQFVKNYPHNPRSFSGLPIPSKENKN